MEKFELLEKTGFRERRISAPWPTPMHKLRMMFMVWNISIGQPELAAWL